MKNKKGVIYEIVNSKNFKKYIGASTIGRERWLIHKRSLRKNNHYNKHLQEDYNKHGEEVFTFNIIEDNISIDILKNKEKEYIIKEKSIERGYNYKLEGGDFFKHSEIDKKRMSKNRRGKNNPFFGRKHTKETKNIISKKTEERFKEEDHVFTGKGFSEEHRSNLSKSRKNVKGENNPSSKVSRDKAIEIYNKYKNKNITYKELAKKNNLSRLTIGEIVKARHWATKHLDDLSKGKKVKNKENRLKYDKKVYYRVYYEYIKGNGSYKVIGSKYGLSEDTVGSIIRHEHFLTENLTKKEILNKACNNNKNYHEAK